MIVLKKGPKLVSVFGFLLGGIVMIMIGKMTGLTGIAVCLFLIQLAMLSFSFMTTNNIIANWFPTKKGVVLGITTTGLALGNTIMTPVFSKISTAYGLGFLACIAAVSQLVAFAQFRGFTLSQSLTIMSIGGIASAVISFISGVIDQKWGTKKATILYCILCLVSYIILMLVLEQPIIALFLVFVVGLNGAPGNLTPSMFITKFGAKDYTAVNRLLMPVVMVLRSCSYFVVGMAISVRGSYADIYGALTIVIIISFVLLMLINAKEIETAPK